MKAKNSKAKHQAQMAVRCHVGLKRETTQCHAVNVRVTITIHIYENIHPQTQHDVAHRSLPLDTAQAPRCRGPVATTPTAAHRIDRSVQADAEAGPGRAPGVYHGGRSTRPAHSQF